MNGLSKQEIEYRKNNGLCNNEKIRYTRSIKEIILANTITLFNILNITLAILVLSTGLSSIKHITFISTIIFNTLIAIFQEIKAKRILDNIRVTRGEEVIAIREGERVRIPKEDIVLDDTLYLSSGDCALVDVEVIKGINLEVSEAVITGESESILKKMGDRIMSGSIITSGSAYVRVISVGKNNYANNLVKEAASIKDNSSYLQNVINKILKLVTIIIVPLGIWLFISQYFYSNLTYSEAILGSVTGIIGMIPEGLVLLTSVALTAGVIKMARKNVIIQRLHGIESLSCTDILCLDKTGTITDGTMEVVEVIKLDKRYDVDDIIANINREDSNNATDIALKNKFGIKDNLQVSKRVAFSSSRKYSMTIIDDKKYYLGALEYITNEKITDYKEVKKYLDMGYRILTLAMGEDDAKVIAFIIIRDNIRPSAEDTLRYFKEEGVEVKIISGDNPITVSNILKSLHFDGYDKYIDGKDLPNDYDELIKVCKEKVIFGRVTPGQKQLIIKALKEDKTVSMIGDGVNDILGLKEADCGIALGSGVSAAKAVAEVVLTTNDFSVLPSIVNEGRRVVNNIERVASMYLIKTTYSFLLSIMTIIMAHEYPFLPIQLSLISTLCVGLPSFFLALEPNYTKVDKNFAYKVFKNVLPNGITVVFNVFIVIMLCSIFKLDFENYRLVVVSLTGFITLRLLYMICKPLNMWRSILLIFCMISFFEVLILLPSTFDVTRLTISNCLFILVLGYIDTYIIDFLEEIYDNIVDYVRRKKDERKEKNKLG